MKLVDSNVLVYAVNSASPHHGVSAAWLDAALSGAETVGFSWVVVIGFMRVATNPRALPRPASVDQATDRVRRWLAAPGSVLVTPGPRHLDVLTDLITATGTRGNLVNDAHLAALALEHRAEIVTFDTDFARFPGVRWSPPPPVDVTG